MAGQRGSNFISSMNKFQETLGQALEEAVSLSDHLDEIRGSKPENIEQMLAQLKDVTRCRARLEEMNKQIDTNLTRWDEHIETIATDEKKQKHKTDRAKCGEEMDSWKQKIVKYVVQLRIFEAFCEIELKERGDKTDHQPTERSTPAKEETHGSSAASATACAKTENDNDQLAEPIQEESEQPEDESKKKKEKYTRLPLPELKLPHFHGEILEWLSFWDFFRMLVDEQPISPACKLLYLKSTLRGDAKMAVDGFPLTDENYQVVLDILIDRFGREDLISRKLHVKLSSMPTASGSVHQVRQTFDEIQMICRYLERLGEDTNDPLLVIIVKQKFPLWVLEKVVEEDEKRGARMNMSELRKYVDEVIRRAEWVDLLSPDRDEPDSPYGPNAARKQSRRAKCAFCDEGHFPNECETFVTRAERIDVVRDKRLCERCLKAGHKKRECSSTKLCCHCRQNHNSALCPRH